MSEQQQPEYKDNTTSAEVITAEATGERPETQTTLRLEPQSNTQSQQIGEQISVFLGQLPNYLSKFFQEYKHPLINVALFLVAVISLKLVLSVLDALNDIPLLGFTLELIGVGYSSWFAYRFLLEESNRRELSSKIQALRKQVIGEKIANERVSEAIQTQAKELSLVEAPKQEKMTAREDILNQSQELEVKANAPSEPALIENTSESSENREGGVPQLIHPHLPNPELVEAAIHDAEEKSLDFSPPKSADSEDGANSNQ